MKKRRITYNDFEMCFYCIKISILYFKSKFTVNIKNKKINNNIK